MYRQGRRTADSQHTYNTQHPQVAPAPEPATLEAPAMPAAPATSATLMAAAEQRRRRRRGRNNKDNSKDGGESGGGCRSGQRRGERARGGSEGKKTQFSSQSSVAYCVCCMRYFPEHALVGDKIITPAFSRFDSRQCYRRSTTTRIQIGVVYHSRHLTKRYATGEYFGVKGKSDAMSLRRNTFSVDVQRFRVSFRDARSCSRYSQLAHQRLFSRRLACRTRCILTVQGYRHSGPPF